MHTVKLRFDPRSIKAATVIEAEPIKWIFPSIVALIKSLIFLKMHSRAKMAPDSGIGNIDRSNACARFRWRGMFGIGAK
jgi:hypothetical protein